MKPSKTFYKELIHAVILITGIFSFRYSVAEPYVVPTGSMEPTILPGDRLLVMKSAYTLRVPFTHLALAEVKRPKRGDVVVFKYPVDPSITFVKRLIGLPGDEIEVTDGIIRVNGKDAKEIPAGQNQAIDPRYKDATASYFEETLGGKSHLIQRLPHGAQRETRRFVVPSDHYFFMGDNRDDSNDSRYWGFVPASYIQGKAVGIWLSLNNWDSLIPSIRWERFGRAL